MAWRVSRLALGDCPGQYLPPAPVHQPDNLKKTIPLLLVRNGEVSDHAIAALRRSARVHLFLAEDVRSSPRAFALRAARATIVATTRDPVAELVFVRTSGFVGPLILAGESKFAALRDSLVAAGVVEWIPIPIADRELDRVLDLVDALPTPSIAHKPTGLLLDSVDRTVRRCDSVVGLSQREFALLHCLMLHESRPVSINEILEYVWGSQRVPAGTREIVDVNVSQLRKKLERIGVRGAIRTYRGFGYGMSAAMED